jgi:hypothetical protein
MKFQLHVVFYSAHSSSPPDASGTVIQLGIFLWKRRKVAM